MTTVTPSMRIHGWNIHLLSGPDDFHFSGLYQHPGSNLITFRDVVNEMRLCFDIPCTEDPWENIAFMLADSPDDMKRKLPSLVADEDLDECAQHIPRPTRRLEPRYIPLDRTSLDPRYARLPFRRTAKPRRASESPKRRRSDSRSSTDNEQEDIKHLHVPPKMDITPEKARQTIETFRHECLIHTDRCAISGKGQSWCIIPSIGPGLQVCHIIPQQHFYLYPDDQQLNTQDGDEKLTRAWANTWSNKNGILLMNDIRQLFEARLISIHPDTHRIRAFVPYDFITDFNGKKASIPRKVDKLALRHHYEMACIENMAAQMPSGMGFLEIRAPLGRTISLPINTNLNAKEGDPAKRLRLDEESETEKTIVEEEVMESQEEEIQRSLSVEYDLAEDSGDDTS
ncbi:uncharacterized protein FIESC28_05837 [Fusarium coffeatum]|uniref:HNH nuclease domain-containing protein n=1 Tax=Fusarium coffeatum TaxID=231269 RepID=A0A366RRG5_9HYPO|nr:uncharacterized protein FIESC28_05837 [Fusarium coffeatum]RBR18915.1 hypothetical protein FIESC28_05837 [Fusarium coffeatum]